MYSIPESWLTVDFVVPLIIASSTAGDVYRSSSVVVVVKSVSLRLNSNVVVYRGNTFIVVHMPSKGPVNSVLIPKVFEPLSKDYDVYATFVMTFRGWIWLFLRYWSP